MHVLPTVLLLSERERPESKQNTAFVRAHLSARNANGCYKSTLLCIV
jgi:hypothetical protein